MQLWKDRQTEEKLFSLQTWTCLKKAREKRRPASTCGICGHFFWSNGQSRLTYDASPWIILSGSRDEDERAQNRQDKQTKRKQYIQLYIHQRFQASFLSSARTKSWMRTGWGHLMRSWILAGTASKKYATPTYGGKLLPCFQIKKKVTNEHYDQYYPRRPKGGPLGQ